MSRTLYFICPTDCIESIISEEFGGEHYFFTSLGNSLNFDAETVGKIFDLIESKRINEISFVLSSKNKIVLDALGKQDFLGLDGLRDFYILVKKEKEYSQDLWQTSDPQFLISSYHLKTKVEELKLELEGLFFNQIPIKARIYQAQEGVFREIYADPILKEKVSLN